MEITQDNAQIIVIIGIHAVSHLIENGMKLQVLFVSNIKFIDRTDSFVKECIKKTVLPFNGEASVENVMNGTASKTVQDLAVSGKRKGRVPVLVSGYAANHRIRYAAGTH